MAPSVDGMEGCLSPTALAKIFPITNEDITSVSEPFGWLTDVAIRTIILRERCDASQYHTINFVDPTFLERWEDDLITGLHQASHAAIPTFLLPRLDSDWPVSELVIPFNLGNFHWTTIHVDLRSQKVTFYNSIANSNIADRAETLMQCFFAEYRHCFHGDPEAGLVFEDARAAQQNDGSSCGLYTIKNCVTLLKGESPDSRTWNFSQILKIREACARVMREEEEAQFEDSEKEL
jgi:Ulp1 protease family, C-terminal catalytic domain